jgi:heptosyltransferase III
MNTTVEAEPSASRTAGAGNAGRSVRHEPARCQRVGVMRIGSLGDHLIALPIYRGLRRVHASATLTLICNAQQSGNAKLVGPVSVVPEGLFDEIRAYPAISGWSGAAALFRLFRQLGLQRLYYLMPKRTPRQLWRDRLFFKLSGVEVVGLNAAATEPIRRIGVGTHYEHEADRLARAIGAPAARADRTPGNLSLALTATERAEVRQMLGQCEGRAVALSVGTKCDVKHWGAEKWRALVRRLAEIESIERLALIGSADEHEECEALKAAWPRRVDNLCGRLSPRQSAAVIADTRLFVGHDSGPMHMAAAVGVPIVAVFSSRSLPGVWFPLSERSRTHYTLIDCAGCGRERCEDRQKACIRRISVDEVHASCVAMLADDPRV